MTTVLDEVLAVVEAETTLYTEEVMNVELKELKVRAERGGGGSGSGRGSGCGNGSAIGGSATPQCP